MPVKTIEISFGGRRIYDVRRDIAEALAEELEHAEYFSDCTAPAASDERFSKEGLDWYRPIVYAVRGRSEGYYVHFDVMHFSSDESVPPGRLKRPIGGQHAIPVSNLMLAKFYAKDHAVAFAAALTKLVLENT